MELNRTDFVAKKLLFYGLPGTGKSYAAREISRQFKCLLYTSKYVKEDRDFLLWGTEKVIVPRQPFDFVKEFPLWCVFAKRMVAAKIIDCFIVDDFDLVFPNGNWSLAPPQLMDLIINHSHYGLTLMFVTRRPQDLPTKVYEQCEIHFGFNVDAPNVIKKLNEYYEGYGDMVRDLPYGGHDFVFKMIGRPPEVGRFG